MTQYSVAVALFDYLPVMASGLSLYFLARPLRQQLPQLRGFILLALVLVPLAGFCKASWKLLIALGQPDLAWLENMLFILMPPGFLILAFALHHARRNWPQAISEQARLIPRLCLWLCLIWPVAASIYLSLPSSRAWFFYLLAMTSLANAALIFHALLAARKLAAPWQSSLLLIFSFTATLAMSGLARLPDTEASAWIQESVNLFGQTSLAIAFWLLSSAMLAKSENNIANSLRQAP